MASKRLIASIFVKDGIVVKSYGYNFWRPAGHLATALQNLDRWAVDEIVVLDISRNGRIDKRILGEIKKSKISTPLVYGGGIRSNDDIHELLNVGCDRMVLETLLIGHEKVLDEIADTVGNQALIGSLPLTHVNGNLFTNFKSFDHNNQNTSHSRLSITEALEMYRKLPISEILAIDSDNEGNYGSFYQKLFLEVSNLMKSENDKNLIWFGGLDIPKSIELLKFSKTVGIVFGNVNFEFELKIPFIRQELLRSEASSVLRQTNFY